MKAGLAAEIANRFPLLRKVVQNRSKIPNGSVIVYIDPNENRIIINLVTKSQSYENPTYYTLSQALYGLKSLRLQCGKNNIRLPRIGCELNELNITPSIEC